jgi:hypothetical protein
MKRITNLDSAAYVVSDVDNRYEGRTILMRRQLAIPANGIFSISNMSPPAPPVACGLDSVNVTVEDGVAEITWTFRTQFEGVDGATSTQAPEYELTGSTSQEPITSHPKYAKLYEKYAIGEEDGLPVWRMTDPDGQSGSTGLSTSGGSQLNPLYGVTDYLAANAVYKETRFYRGRASIPGNLIAKCGKIDTPESLKSAGGEGRWLRCGAQIRQMGDSYQVTTMWMASQSADNLWKPEIYGGGNSESK